MHLKTRSLPETAAWAYLIVALAGPSQAHAEPSVSTTYMPVLWLIAVVSAFLCAALPLFFRKYLLPRLPRWVAWIISFIVLVSFLILIAPLIVIFGSILITGRTM